MRIETLGVRAFRNLRPATLALGPGVNFVYGPNGQGKTNLLEVAALLVNGASPRTTNLAETVPWGSTLAEIGAVEESYGVRYRVGMRVADSGRSISVDGKTARSVPGVAKGCLALTFLPEDLAILTGEPSLRRDFLDRTLVLLEPSHAADLRAYHGALVTRGRLLRDAPARRVDLDQLLHPYEILLMERGAAIARRRAGLTAELARTIASAVTELELPTGIELTYLPNMPELLDESGEGPGRALARLRDRREVDLAQKRTTLGPHRDDLQLAFKGAGVRSYASRGETRLVMVLLLIAKLRVVMARLNLTPLIILDDIFSELDRERRALVIRALPVDAQVLSSAVERDLHGDWLAGRDGVKAFRVSAGEVVEGEL